MEHRWVVWIGFLIVVAIGLAIGFYDWQSPAKIFAKAKSRRRERVSASYGKEVFSSKTLRGQEQKE